jgi:hypothetical protein
MLSKSNRKGSVNQCEKLLCSLLAYVFTIRSGGGSRAVAIAIAPHLFLTTGNCLLVVDS